MIKKLDQQRRKRKLGANTLKQHLIFVLLVSIATACSPTATPSKVIITTTQPIQGYSASVIPSPNPTSTAIVTRVIPTHTLTPDPNQVIESLKYYWPSSLTSDYKVDACTSSVDNTGFHIVYNTNGEEKRSVEVAGGSGVGWLSYLPPCGANFNLVVIDERSGCLEIDDSRGTFRLFWQEGDTEYAVVGFNLQAEEVLELARSLIVIPYDTVQRRLIALITPTVTPSSTLIYYWPSEDPEGFTIFLQDTSADDKGFALVLNSSDYFVSLRILGGLKAPLDESCDNRLRPSTVRGQQGYIDLGTGAGTSVSWRENGHPYFVGGLGVSHSVAQAIAESLEPVDLTTWLSRLEQTR